MSSPTATLSLAAFTLSRRITDHSLRASCPSSDGQRRYTQTIPIRFGKRPTCSCWGYTKHKHCKHADAAAELGARFRDTMAVQGSMGDDTLRSQMAWLAPESVGAVSIAYLCAGYLLRERESKVAA